MTDMDKEITAAAVRLSSCVKKECKKSVRYRKTLQAAIDFMKFGERGPAPWMATGKDAAKARSKLVELKGALERSEHDAEEAACVLHKCAKEWADLKARQTKATLIKIDRLIVMMDRLSSPSGKRR